ncbi:glyoxylase-like metal-dependent hydrolase (beta-lactamase superfamily II) [Christiangramia gaetbulicola]|uniref:Glyoxylase-like metal-dependent hydrolase (Beta-lactamase superfamily II) n=1 Tax=Christiangramia gaetbulicola TaxID=703340 RepID=A0A2T6AHX3_9FLAO|nr:MBL fold metallo-hydrolase [Christiangramia gaetbulicola]PTX43406.1 glyoxylase-like metal-dependent hydrolase (beta-lactamase superfamily II) [Christiangramia gaetbulicola]
MTIKQFKDDPLAHFSYAIVSNGEMALVDPSRNPMEYYRYAEEQNARIVAVFETHPHADFVSSHMQIHEQTGATIYVSELLGADYPHKTFDDGDTLKMGDTNFSAINTPGHSPDSITIVAKEGDKTALFTGDTLFIGNVGRPDLREKAGNMKAKRVDLAKQMYNTIKNKFNDLPDDALVYPAHGAGSLCGKNMSDASSSTLGNERQGNWAFKEQTEDEFVEEILKDQPFIPHYFGFNVDVNKTGPENVQRTKWANKLKLYVEEVEDGITIVDTRSGEAFKDGHLHGSINIMARSEKDKYETWLGAIIKPEEEFYLVIESIDNLEEMLERTAKIGYEKQVKAVITLSDKVSEKSDQLDLEDFKNNKDNYTIVDIRNNSEVADGKIFEDAIAVPLNELRENTTEIPSHKPVVVHCAGGYRSAAGSSILDARFENTKVYDLSDAINDFK